MPTEQYLNAVLLLLVSIAAVNDLATRRIPNRLLLTGLSVALVLHLLSAEPGTALLRAFSGLGLGLAVFLPFYLLRGMAAGDVKMMAVVGAFTGAALAFEIAVLTWCAGGVMALVLVVARGRLRQTIGNIGRMLLGLVTLGHGAIVPAQDKSAGTMPYGVAIAIGTVAVLARHYG
ncbi:prepilin peptidase [Massilia sp. 9096]|uniref:A24 family peptidase n=1 Tax=Massilia sp. 9096 TaxID=1500894 RepID=UPI00056A231E|nr:prepilin peptidase [Massilia sp. 9096]